MKKTNMNGIVALMIVFGFVVSSLPAFAQAPEVKPLNTTLLNEGFEAGFMPPTGWKIINYTSQPDVYSWKIASDKVHTGSFSTKVVMSSGAKQDEKLISPLIDLTSAYGCVILDFWCYTSNPGDTKIDVKLYVDKDGDGFQENEVVWSLLSESPYEWRTCAWREKQIDLSSYLGSKIQLQWRYDDLHGGSSYLDVFYLDDVQILTPQIAIKQIGYGSRISAKICNIGTTAVENINWTISVKGGMLGGINAMSNGVISKLKPSGDDKDTLVVNSGSFFGFGPVQIEVTAWINDAQVGKVSRSMNGFVILSECYPMTRLFSNQSYFD